MNSHGGTGLSVRPGPLTRVGLVAFLLVSLVSALMAGLVGVLDLSGRSDPFVDVREICGDSGFQAFWDRYGWACLLALAVALAASAILVPVLLRKGRRMLALALIAVTLFTAPIPWLIQTQQPPDDVVVCFQL
ncbi:MAG TPA: hypothetical protein VLI04_22620 [Nocardioidaceae bacterium]|nr:hypothetical protein [Nocardioidaceae bacterium]